MRSPRSCAALLPLLLAALSLLPPLPGVARAAGAPGVAWEAVVDAYPLNEAESFVVMHDLVPTGDGGAVAAGYAIPPAEYETSETGQEALVVRLDAAGRELWRASLGDGLAGRAFEARRIRRTPDGGFVVACNSFHPDSFTVMSFLYKLDAGGNPSWRLDFDTSRLEGIGDVDVLPDGSILAGGNAWLTEGDATRCSTAVAKVSPSGALLWVRNGGMEPRGGVARMAATADGGFYASTDGGGGGTVTVSRYGADGALLWDTEITGVDADPYYFEKPVHGVAPLPGGGCAVWGAARTTDGLVYGPYRPWVASFDAAGRQSSVLVVPTTSPWNQAVERLADGGLVSAESVEGSEEASALVRYDAAGREQWRLPVGSDKAGAYLQALRAGTDGRIVAAGSFQVSGPVEGGEWAVRKGYVLALDGGAPVTDGGAPKVRIDVLPGNSENPVNPRSKGLLPVALLSGPGFDACRVDPASITLEGAPVAKAGRKYHAVKKDADGDGRCDLLLHFSVPALNLTAASTAVTMRGTAPGGAPFSASDAIRVVGVPPPKCAPPARKGTGVVRKGGGR